MEDEDVDSLTIYTVGHSDRTLDDFLPLLMTCDIKTLIDVRSYPYSTRFPHFSQEALREAVNVRQIEYHWAGRQLGGKRQPNNPESHPALTTDSLRGFAEYMQTDQFEQAITQLVNLADGAKTAILCAEKLQSHCHRALISDYLLIKNLNVIHIIDSNTREEHQLSSSARMESTRLVYDRNVTSSLKFQ